MHRPMYNQFNNRNYNISIIQNVSYVVTIIAFSPALSEGLVSILSLLLSTFLLLSLGLGGSITAGQSESGWNLIFVSSCLTILPSSARELGRYLLPKRAYCRYTARHTARYTARHTAGILQCTLLGLLPVYCKVHC